MLDLVEVKMICKRVLVIDDEKEIRECISDILGMDGYIVVQASNGQEALDYLKSLAPENLPGIIMLDLSMPIMDGATFLKEIKENHKEFHSIPIVVVSARHSSKPKSSLDHAVERLNKPIGFDEINRVVRQYCGKPPKGLVPR